MFLNHFVPSDYSFLQGSKFGSTFVVYDINGNMLEKRSYTRSDPITPTEVSFFMEWFRVLDLDLDGYSLPSDDISLFFLDHFNIETDSVKSYVVNKYADKLLENSPVTGMRLRFLHYLTANRILSEVGFERLYADYADKIAMGSDTYGVKAAAEVLFNKNIHRANQKEKAFIFSLLKGYEFYEPIENFAAAERRANIYLNLLYQRGVIERDEYVTARDYRITMINPQEHEPEEIDYLRAVSIELKEYGVETGDACSVYTFFDPEKTEMLRKTVSEYMKTKDKGVQSAFVLMDIEKGGIVAMVGAREGKSLKRALYTVRQPGSTFKPIVYATAFENGAKPTDKIDDVKKTYKNGYSPNNFDDIYMGNTAVRNGLVYSLNNASIQLAEKTGLKKVAEKAKALGMKADVKPYYAMPLGVFAVTPANLAQVYASIADSGLSKKRGLIEHIEFADGRVIFPNLDSRQSLDPKAAFQTLYIMQDVPRKGTAKGKGIMEGTSAKTGTSDHYKDAWTAAVFYPYVAVAWVGYDSDKSMGDKGTGGAVAAPLIAEVQKKLLMNGEKITLKIPEGIELLKVGSADGRLITLKCVRKKGYIEAFNADNLPPECVK